MELAVGKFENLSLKDSAAFGFPLLYNSQLPDKRQEYNDTYFMCRNDRAFDSPNPIPWIQCLLYHKNGKYHIFCLIPPYSCLRRNDKG